MSDEFDFEPRLGKIGHRKSARTKPFDRQVLDVAYKSGFKPRWKSSFTGQRIARGAAWGTLASAGFMNKGGRRADVKVRITKLRSGNLAAPRAHLRYLQRDGVDRSGESRGSSMGQSWTTPMVAHSLRSATATDISSGSLCHQMTATGFPTSNPLCEI